MHEIIHQNGHVNHQANWLTPEKQTQLLLTLEQELNWQQEDIILFGKRIKCPRLTAWYGDREIEYQYSGVNHVAQDWHPLLLSLQQRLAQELQIHFNSVLCNLYRDGQDSMGWHADNEKVLGKNPTIASISLGATRKFQFKHRATKEIVTLELEPGSLLIMTGAVQHYWLHRLPKQNNCFDTRVNLTFRQIKT